MNEEYIKKADLLLDLIDERNILNNKINKVRNELRELKKRRKEKN